MRTKEGRLAASYCVTPPVASHTIRTTFCLLVFIVLVQGQKTTSDPQLKEPGTEGTTIDSNVTILSATNWDEELKTRKVALVEFYAPWCSICKRLAPEWERAADLLHQKFALPPKPETSQDEATVQDAGHKIEKDKDEQGGKHKKDKKKDKKHKNKDEHHAEEDLARVLFKVDCTIEKELCQREAITGYPTIKVFRYGINESGRQYRGEKNAEAIVAFVSRLLLPPVTTLTTSGELMAFKNSTEEVVIVGYFGSGKKGKGDTAELLAFESAAAELNERGDVPITFGKVIDSDLLKQLQADGEFGVGAGEAKPEEGEQKGEEKHKEKEKEKKKDKGKEKDKEKEKGKDKDKTKPALVLYRKTNTHTFYFESEELKQFYPPSLPKAKDQKTETAKGKEKKKEKEKDKEKKKKEKKEDSKNDLWTKEGITSWILQHRLPLLTKFDKTVFGNERPVALVFIDLPNDQNAVPEEFVSIMEKVYHVAKGLRDKGKDLRFGWVDKETWSGTRLGLSGDKYPALAISDLRKLNHHYAFGELTPANVGSVEEWVQKFLEGTLPLTRVSQPLSEVHDFGESIKNIVADTFEDEVIKPNKHVMVMFHSPFCGTSRKYYPVFQQLAQRFAEMKQEVKDSVLFLAGDGWANDFPHELQLTGMPDLRFFSRNDKARPAEFVAGGPTIPDVETLVAWVQKQILRAEEGQPPTLTPTNAKDEL